MSTISSTYLSCFSGSGCLVNITVAQAQVCWQSGGSLAGNVDCAPSNLGFCTGGNQTYLVGAFEELRYGDPPCKGKSGSSGSSKSSGAARLGRAAWFTVVVAGVAAFIVGV